jgi:hypothetical protein
VIYCDIIRQYLPMFSNKEQSYLIYDELIASGQLTQEQISNIDKFKPVIDEIVRPFKAHPEYLGNVIEVCCPITADSLRLYIDDFWIEISPYNPNDSKPCFFEIRDSSNTLNDPPAARVGYLLRGAMKQIEKITTTTTV